MPLQIMSVVGHFLQKSHPSVLILSKLVTGGRGPKYKLSVVGKYSVVYFLIAKK